MVGKNSLILSNFTEYGRISKITMKKKSKKRKENERNHNEKESFSESRKRRRENWEKVSKTSQTFNLIFKGLLDGYKHEHFWKL